jgi:tetratricopeptide (TPR) repeat protein
MQARRVPGSVLGLILIVGTGAACAGSYRTGAGYAGDPGIAPTAYEHYIRGRIAADRGDHDTALAELRMAAAAAPDEVEPRVAVGEELLSAGRFDAALTEAGVAVREWPRDPAPWRLLGRVRAAATDVAGAAQAFERAVQLDATDETSWLMLAAAFRQLHDESSAVGTYRRLIAALPESAEGHFRLGRALVAVDLAEAVDELRRAIELDAGHIDARVTLAELYRRRGQTGEAEQALREAFDRSGDDATVGERLYRLLLEGGDRKAAAAVLRRLDADWRDGRVRVRLAYFLLQLHEADDALRIARDVLARDAGEHTAHVIAARALGQLGRRAEAVAACLAVPAAADAYAEARALAAELHGRMGTPQDGLTLLGEALAARPDDPLVLAAAATLHEQLGGFDQARRLLDAALARTPADETLAYARAALEDRAADPDRAVAVMQGFLERNRDSVVALNFIGFSYAERGIELDTAERLLRHALELRPDDGFVLDSLGWLFLRRGRLDQARDALERADRLAPFEPEILFHLGELYLGRGQDQRARDTFRQALALDPTGKVRTRLEERVRTLEARAP